MCICIIFLIHALFSFAYTQQLLLKISPAETLPCHLPQSSPAIAPFRKIAALQFQNIPYYHTRSQQQTAAQCSDL